MLTYSFASMMYSLLRLFNVRSVIFFIPCVHYYAVIGQNLHVKLEGTHLTKEEYIFLQKGLNFQLNFFYQVFDSAITNKISATVFSTEKQYHTVAKLHKTRHTLGFYDPDGDRLYLFRQANFNNIFQHELSHGLFDKYCPTYYGWVDEGIAEFFEHVSFDSSQYHFNIPESVIADVKKLLSDNFQLKKFLSLNYSEWKSLPVNDRYNMAWAVTFFMIRSDMDVFTNILQALCDGSDLIEAVEQHYPAGFTMFEADLRSMFLNYQL